MNVLSVIHGTDARTELFAPRRERRDTGSTSGASRWGTPPPRPLEAYDAVLVFGGAMHADQDDAPSVAARRRRSGCENLLERHTPVLGVCLGVQLLARAAGAWVGPAAGARDRLVRRRADRRGRRRSRPRRAAAPFEALQWHHYTYGVPEGAVELARSAACTQAFRLGEACWGVQFHPEVTQPQLDGWIVDTTDPPPEPDGCARRRVEHIARWNELGRALCAAFLETAELVLERAA